MGARKLLAWLRAPLLDVVLIGRRHACVEGLVNDAATREQLRGAALRTMPDVQKLLSRFTRGKATLLDVLKLYQAVQGIPAVVK
jgi:DNA mismatch repair protein MSH2